MYFLHANTLLGPCQKNNCQIVLVSAKLNINY